MPGHDKISSDSDNDGNRLRGLLQSPDRCISMGHDDVDLVTNQISRKLWKPVEFSFGPAILNSDVLSLDVAVLAQTLSEPLDASRDSGGGAVPRNPIRGIFCGCCAPAMTATASSTTTNRIDKTRAFLIAQTCITRTVAVEEKSEIYNGSRRVFTDWAARFIA